MTNIGARLRGLAPQMTSDRKLRDDAADEIERLTAEVEAWRGQLAEQCGQTLVARAEIERLRAQVSRDNEHYQAAMAMAEKHRTNWVEACQEREQLRTELATVIERTGYHLLRPKP